MKKSISQLVCVALSLFVSACEQGKPDPDTQTNDASTDAPTSVEFDFSAHWLKPDVFFIRPHTQADQIKLYYSLSGEIRQIKDADNKAHNQALEDSSGTASISAAPSTSPLPANSSLALGSSSYFTLVALDPERLKQTSLSPPTNKHRAYRLKETIEPGAIKLMLRGQLRVVQKNQRGDILHSSRVQYAKLLDTLYTKNTNDANEINDFGAVLHEAGTDFKVWAPTALELEVLLFNQDKTPMATPNLPMQFDSHSGVWTASGPRSLKNTYYQYAIKIYHPATDKVEHLISTDPYSLSLSVNSEYSQVVDLNDPASKPAGWDEQQVLKLKKYEDSIFYEAHVRDFSAADKNLSRPSLRGKYKAFTEQSSDGIKHLRALKSAGLNHIHLLPIFDIATVDEDPAKRVSLDDSIAKLCVIRDDLSVCQDEKSQLKSLREILSGYRQEPTTGEGQQSDKAQALIEAIRHIDDYNWGYDPYHYTVPEGSYALNPEGLPRIVEFREMVLAFHQMGLRVVMDVVYNHTHSNETTDGRLHRYAVLDKFVPNYYNRLDPVSGTIENSTCCANTATEHVMMGKLMTDSLVTWTRDYKIDGFRFDLMGHQPKSLMLSAYDNVRKIDPDNYFYGEGWNFGEVANNALFVQATQVELAGSEIGTFSDRLRDAVRGPGFNSGEDVRKAQGIGNGLYLLPNDLTVPSKEINNAAENPQDEITQTRFQLNMDQLRVGLAGNLANYPLLNSEGTRVKGKDISYGDAPSGYALDPADTINYVSKHDNQTLWDNHQYRLPYDLNTAQRVRFQLLSLSYPLLAQGIPFIHMGSELLRSKSFLRDSYDYGDWFNKVDFSRQSNNYGLGRPPKSKDGDKWSLINTLIQKNEGRDIPSPKDIDYAFEIFQEFLRIRSESELFRLGDEKSIIERLSFLNSGPGQLPGLIAMQINDEGFGEVLDARYTKILVLFNSSGSTISFPHPQAKQFRLHPIQAQGQDKVLRNQLEVTNGAISIPPITAAVMVLPGPQ